MTSAGIQNSDLGQQRSSGKLLGLLTAAFYVLFTLLPDSNSAMVEWPWVLFWQVGLLCPVLWFLGLLWQKRLRWLGNKLDWVVGGLLVGLVSSTLLASFPMQARWYTWAVVGYLAALYCLSSHLDRPQRCLRLLIAQGILNLVFIVVSLLLWTSQVYIPELWRLHDLQQLGVTLPFDFANIQLRNGSPIGHQNYVAGYLVLALPLIVGLGVMHQGWQRWLWFAGMGLGLIDLYTTNSRAGWLGIVVLVIIGFVLLLWRSTLPRRWLWLAGIAGLISLMIIGFTNNRLRGTVTNLLTGQGGGEVAYRLITVTTGWRMGLSHLFSGVGLGGVPLLYQKYRPTWAGYEAESHYQLHSTPAQIWAELGLLGVLLILAAMVLLTYLAIRWGRVSRPFLVPPLLIGCLFSGLLAYAIFSLVDYQLDNLCISGTIVIYLAVLISEFRHQMGEETPDSTSQTVSSEVNSQASSPTLRSAPSLPFSLPPSLLSLAAFGILLAVVIWLIPIHRAWMLSSQGFVALSRDDVNGFAQRLQQAHQLAPWEPYYANQLGWNLGNLGLQTKDSKQSQVLMEDGITWLQQAIAIAPQQEFGHTNLGWLLLNQNPKAAAQSFARAAQLIPAKRGVFYGLGLSQLAQSKPDQALTAMLLEVLRDPSLMTSPVWKLPDLQPLYLSLLQGMERRYTTLLNTATAPALIDQLRQLRGGLRWWVGDFKGARADLENSDVPVAKLVLDLAEGKPVQTKLAQMAPSAGTLAIAAWFDPTKRQSLLQQAWIMAMQTTPDPEILQKLVETMSRSSSFDQWLKQNAPSRTYRRERVGFGVISRHAEGPAPVDFMTVVENIPVTQFFASLIPSYVFAPDLDKALQPERDSLLQHILD